MRQLPRAGALGLDARARAASPLGDPSCRARVLSLSKAASYALRVCSIRAPSLLRSSTKAGEFVIELRAPFGDLLHIARLLLLPPQMRHSAHDEEQGAGRDQQDVLLHA